jgi:hypothetical protein
MRNFRAKFRSINRRWENHIFKIAYKFLIYIRVIKISGAFSSKESFVIILNCDAIEYRL